MILVQYTKRLMVSMALFRQGQLSYLRLFRVYTKFVFDTCLDQRPMPKNSIIFSFVLIQRKDFRKADSIMFLTLLVVTN